MWLYKWFKLETNHELKGYIERNIIQFYIVEALHTLDTIKSQINFTLDTIKSQINFTLDTIKSQLIVEALQCSWRFFLNSLHSNVKLKCVFFLSSIRKWHLTKEISQGTEKQT